MERKMITLSNMVLPHFSYQAARAAAKAVRKASLSHGLRASKSPFLSPLAPV